MDHTAHHRSINHQPEQFSTFHDQTSLDYFQPLIPLSAAGPTALSEPNRRHSQKRARKSVGHYSPTRSGGGCDFEMVFVENNDDHIGKN